MTRRASLALPLLVVAAAAAAIFPHERAAHAGEARSTTWDGKTPFSCSSGHHVIDGVSASVTGTAVVAHGSCQLVIVNSKIHGTVSAVTAHGAASIRVATSSLSSGGAVVVTHGSSAVVLESVHVSGRIAVAAHGVTEVTATGGSRLSGEPIAITASGSARVKVAVGCSVDGGTTKSDSSRVAID